MVCFMLVFFKSTVESGFPARRAWSTRHEQSSAIYISHTAGKSRKKAAAKLSGSLPGQMQFAFARRRDLFLYLSINRFHGERMAGHLFVTGTQFDVFCFECMRITHQLIVRAGGGLATLAEASRGRHKNRPRVGGLKLGADEVQKVWPQPAMTSGPGLGAPSDIIGGQLRWTPAIEQGREGQAMVPQRVCGDRGDRLQNAVGNRHGRELQGPR